MAGTQRGGPGGPVDHELDRQDALYARLQETEDFAELRRRYRSFVFPATLAFIVWYALYVVLSMWANGFMSQKVVGNINVALVFGLLQFGTTFALAWVYAKYSNKRLDPLARKLDEQFIELSTKES